MAKKTDIKKTGDKELLKNLAEKREELRKMRFDLAGSKNKNTKLVKNTKKDVARILTELTARHLANK
jgi:large subunit ribosomal protein L29